MIVLLTVFLITMWEMLIGLNIEHPFCFSFNVLADTVKEGVVTDDKLHDLARDVIGFWKNLGRELRIPEQRLVEIDIDYESQGVAEKAYQMLLFWRDRYYPSTTFHCIYNVLCDQRLCRRDLALKHCC